MRKMTILSGVFLASLLVLSACGKKEAPMSPSSPDVTMTETVKNTDAEKNTDAGKNTDASDAAATVNADPSFSNFKAVTLDGKEVDQSIFANSDLTMINIWATYCGPCLSEMPELGEINEEYKDKGFKIVGIVSDVINSDGSLSETQVQSARDVVTKTGANYMQLVPTHDLMMAKLKDVYAVPTTIFVDKNGKQVGEDQLGSKSKDDWIKLIDQYLGEVKKDDAK